MHDVACDSCRVLQAAGASTVCAVLDMLGVGGIVAGIPLRGAGGAYAGPAYTVKAVVGPLGTYAPADFDIPAYVDRPEPGSVVAIDAGGAAVSLAGGIAARASALRSVRGWVVDGGMRDGDELCDAGIPLHVRHVVPVSGRTRVRIEATQVPITIAGVTVRPGDILVGDETGVGCVPREVVETVAKMADWIRERDGVAAALVEQGRPFKEAFAAATAQVESQRGPLA